VGRATAAVGAYAQRGGIGLDFSDRRHAMTGVAAPALEGPDETDRAILRELRQRVEDAVARLNDGQAVIDEATLRETIAAQVQAYQRWARQENRARLSDPGAAEHELLRERIGAGPLQRYLDDPLVQEIGVVGPDRSYVWLRDGSKHLLPEILFRTDEEIGELVRRLIAPSGRRLDAESPIVGAMLPEHLVRNGARLSAAGPEVSPNGTAVTIRKFPRRFRHAEDLVERDMLTWSLASYLTGCVDARANMLISGPMHSGKSTLLDVLLCSMGSSDERVILIEDPHELSADQVLPDVIVLQARAANAANHGAITQRQLLKAAFRHRADRIVVGEILGDEAWDMLQAMASGHPGSLATIHAETPRLALKRLALWALMALPGVTEAYIADWIASTIDLVIQLNYHRPSGLHYVASVAEIDGREGDVPRLQELWRRPRHDQPLRWTGRRSKLEERFESAGVEWSAPPSEDAQP
jgi:pilus assembly protein CpaF